MQITSSSVGGYGLEITAQGRAKTDTIIFGRSEEEAELGNAYNVNTGLITLTSANKSAVLYLKNNETFPLVLEGAFYNLGTSTGGSGEALISILRNPTAGTIVSNAAAAEMSGVNRNFGSNQTLDATIYKGAEASTFTDGTKVIESYLPVPRREVVRVGDVILPKGASIGIDITPPASNTSLKVEFALSIYIDTLTDV
jgi:hypothetical protein